MRSWGSCGSGGTAASLCVPAGDGVGVGVGTGVDDGRAGGSGARVVRCTSAAGRSRARVFFAAGLDAGGAGSGAGGTPMLGAGITAGGAATSSSGFPAAEPPSPGPKVTQPITPHRAA